jgi:hypothetical protein
MRRFVALPFALLMSLAVAGSAFAAFCGVESKPDGAGQKVVILVDLITGHETIVSGANAAGRAPGGFADVYLDFDFSGDISAGDCKINDTFLISGHSGKVSPGQELDGLGVLPPVHDFSNPGGFAHGAGFATLANCPF